MADRPDDRRRLDELDLAIIRLLVSDGRLPARRIAQQLGVGEPGVRQRLQRLLADGTVRITAWVEHSVLGRPIMALLSISVVGDPAAVAERIAAHEQFDWVYAAADLTTVVASLTTASFDDLREVVNEEVRTLPGVRTVDVGIHLRVWPTAFRGGPNGPTDANPMAIGRRSSAPAVIEPSRTRPVDRIDVLVLQALIDDGRVSLTKLAGLTGLSLAATRQRLVRIIDDGIARIKCITDLAQLGFPVGGTLNLRLAGDVTAIAQRVAADPNVVFLAELTGPMNLVVDVFASDDHDLKDCVRRLTSIPGIHDMTFVRIGEIVKLTMPGFDAGPSTQLESIESKRDRRGHDDRDQPTAPARSSPA